MEENGALFHDVELRESRENLMRGVYAKKDFKKGDQLIFVPYSGLMERNQVIESPIGKMMFEKDLWEGKGTLWFPSVTMMAMMYLQEVEKGEESKFYLFLKNWPKTDDFPQLYTQEEMDML